MHFLPNRCGFLLDRFRLRCPPRFYTDNRGDGALGGEGPEVGHVVDEDEDEVVDGYDVDGDVDRLGNKSGEVPVIDNPPMLKHDAFARSYSPFAFSYSSFFL
jgi:hypothetical protein